MKTHINKLLLSVLTLSLILVTLYGCASAPYSGRKQILLISEGEEMSLGVKAYHDVLKKEKIIHRPEG